MDFAGAINYMVGCIGKIPTIILGLTYYTGGGVQRTINRLSDNSVSIDMTNAENTVYDGISVSFFCGLICSILTMVFTMVSGGIGGVIFGGLGTIGVLIASVIGFAVWVVIITICKANTTHWNMVLVKVWSVLYLIYAVISLIHVVTSIVSLISGILHFYSIFSLLLSIVTVLTNIVSILGAGMILNGLTGGNPIAGQQPNFNQQGFGQQQPNDYWNQQGQAGVNQGFGQQGAKQTGFGDFNQGFGQQQQDFQSHAFETRSQTQQPQSGVQMYQCPFCGKPIQYGANPCPHCNNAIQWQ